MVSGVPRAGVGWTHAGRAWHAMIWTTTPWTLPANVAIAVHPGPRLRRRPLRRPGDRPGRPTILAAELVAKVMALRQRSTEVAATLPRPGARGLEHAAHPFIDRVSPIVLAEYVSVEDGTGLVHTAPGHGAEDYQTGRAYQLPILSPVDDVGPVHRTRPRTGWPASRSSRPTRRSCARAARSRATCFHEQPLVHSYPHCWRCKKPVIFRATEQWFIGVDHNDLRGRTLEGDRARSDWLPGLGPDADRGDGLAPARLVHQPRSGPGACRSPPSAARPAAPSC